MPPVSWFPVYIILFVCIFFGLLLAIFGAIDKNDASKFVSVVLITVPLLVMIISYEHNGYLMFPDREMVLNHSEDYDSYVGGHIWDLDTAFLIEYLTKTKDPSLKIDIGAELAKRRFRSEQELKQQATPIN